MKRLHSALKAVAVFALCGLLAGCSSNGGGGTRTAESKKAVESLGSTRQELAKAKGEVQKTNASLDKLAAGGDLSQTYKQYTQQVAQIKAAGDRSRVRAQDMSERGRLYVANWEKEMDQISNPELKAGAAERRAKVKANYDQIQTAAATTRDAYQPYLRNLQDIQRALANDLTPAGVESAKLAIDKAKTEGQTLVERLDMLIAELDEVGASMSGKPSVAGTPQAAGK